MAKRLLSLLLVLTMLFSVSVPAFAEAAGTEPAPAEQSGEPAPAGPVDGEETPAPDLPQGEPETAEDPGADSAPAPEGDPEMTPAPEETPETTPVPEEPPASETAPDPDATPSPDQDGPQDPAEGEAPGGEDALPPADGEVPGEEDTLAPEEAEETEDGTALLSAPLTGSCGAQGDNLTWTLTPEGTLTISGNGDMADYEYASSPWFGYGTRFSSEEYAITRIVIEEGVTGIGNFAFYSAWSVETVEFPQSLTSIRNYAFDGASRLKELALPGSLEQLSIGAFSGCSALTELTVPGSVRSIEDSAFSDCQALTSLTLEDGLEHIGYSAFYNTALTRVTVPESVLTIGELAFGYRYDEGNYIVLPDFTLEGYAGGAAEAYARDNPGVAFVPLGPSDNTILAQGECGAQGGNVVWKLDAMGVVTVSGTGAMAEYVNYEFSQPNYYDRIRSVVVEEGITYLGDLVFCGGASSFSLPASLTGFSTSAFTGSWLESITVSEASEHFSSRDGILFNKDGTALLRLSNGKAAESYTVPDGVTELGTDSLSHLENLREVLLPEGLKTIGIFAMADDKNLASITIPDTVVSIDDRAFAGAGLTGKVVLPESVANVGYGAFSYCTGLTKLTFNNPVCAIAPNCTDSCQEDLIIAGYDESTAQSFAADHGYMFISLGPVRGLTSGVIREDYSDIQWFFRDGVLSLRGNGVLSNYNNAGDRVTFPWESYADQIKTVSIGRDIQLNDPGALFSNCRNLAAYEISGNDWYTVEDGVLFSGQRLAAYAPAKEGSFYRVPDTVREIDPYAFSNCASLTEIDVSPPVVTLEYGTFTGCTNLKTLTVRSPLCRLQDIYGPPDDSDLIAPQGTVLCGYEGSTIQEYAAQHGYTFQTLGPIPGELETVSGNYGQLHWSIGTDRVLHISGSGPMKSPEWDDYPWRNYQIVEKVVIEEGVTSLNARAFANLLYLRTVCLPSTLDRLEINALECPRLERLEVAPGNQVYESDGKALFTKGRDTLLFYCSSPMTNDSSYTVPDGVRHIGAEAFYGAWLSYISLPEGLLTIGDRAFEDNDFQQVILPSTVTRIGAEAFFLCYQLKKILIPASVTEIGERAIGYILEWPNDPVADKNLTIYGAAGSAAETYAKANGLPFVADTELLGLPIYTLENTAKGIRISWQPVRGAEKYRIYKTDERTGSWKPLAETKNLEYIWTGAKAGYGYLFTVEALKGKTGSGYDENGLWIARLTQPALPKITGGAGGLSLTWTAVKGAESYNILVKEGAGAWENRYTSGTNSILVPQEDLKANTEYTFSIQAKQEGSLSSYNTTGTKWVTVGASNAPTAVNGVAGIELTWPRVDTAQKYQVYYRVTGTEKWIKAGTSTSTAYTWKGAKANTSYEFAVQGLKGKFSGAYSDASASITRLTQPALPKVTGGEGGLTLTWTAIKGMTGSYHVYVKEGAGAWERKYTVTANSCTVPQSDLKEDTDYLFSIQSEMSGSVSAWNGKGTAWTVVGVPSAPNVKNGATGVELSWNGVTTAQKYQVYYRSQNLSGGKWLKAGTTTGTSYTWRNARANNTYEFAVQGLKGKFSGAYSKPSASITRLTQPALPKVTGGEDGLSLTWTAVKGMTGSYHVYVKEGAGDWARKYTVTTNSCTVPQTALKEDTEYLFSIQAEMNGSVSAWNGKGTAWTVVGMPGTPTAVNGAKGVELNWTGVTTAQKYQVYYRSQNLSGGKWLKAGTATGTSYTWRNARANTTYEFAVQGLKGRFSGAYSDASAAITRLTQPALPKVTGGEGGLNLTWTAIKGMTGSYHVYVKEGDGAWESEYTSGTNSFLVPQGDLKENTEYTFSVQAEMNGSFSSYNPSGTRWVMVGTPGAPEVKNGAKGIELNWTGAGSAQKYQVYYRTQNPDGGKWLKAGTTAGTSYTWKGAKAGTAYIFAVQGLKGKFSGVYSESGATLTRVTQPALPKIVQTEGGLALSWTAVKGAVSYEILVNEGGGWRTAGTSGTNNYEWTGPVTGGMSFSIRAVAADKSASSVHETGKTWGTAVKTVSLAAPASLPESAAEKTEPVARLSVAKPGEGAVAGYRLSLVAEPRVK